MIRRDVVPIRCTPTQPDPAIYRRNGLARAATVVAIGALACAAASCSGGSGTSAGSRLEAALSHVADTASARDQISYDDTAWLVHLTGKHLTGKVSITGFAALRGLGAPTIEDLAYQLRGDTGIDLFGESYAITTGTSPQILTLLEGGQNAAVVTSRLIKLGWKHAGGKLVGPPFSSVSSHASEYALAMPRVSASGSDVTFGGLHANLAKIGAPSGATLDDDPRISALARCLGDVVAARMLSGGNLGGRGPAAVAVGVRRPAAKTAVPHAVVCAAWSSQAEAARYAADVRRALTSGVSLVTDQQYSVLLRHTSVTAVPGSQHVVRWQADTPLAAARIFQMLDALDLPALPDCGRLSKLPPSAQARVVGCS